MGAVPWARNRGPPGPHCVWARARERRAGARPSAARPDGVRPAPQPRRGTRAPWGALPWATVTPGPWERRTAPWPPCLSASRSPHSGDACGAEVATRRGEAALCLGAHGSSAGHARASLPLRTRRLHAAPLRRQAGLRPASRHLAVLSGRVGGPSPPVCLMACTQGG